METPLRYRLRRVARSADDLYFLPPNANITAFGNMREIVEKDATTFTKLYPDFHLMFSDGTHTIGGHTPGLIFQSYEMIFIGGDYIEIG